MVAVADSPPNAGLSTMPDFARGGQALFPRFTIADVDALVRLGVLPEDNTFELLDGFVVRKNRAATGADINTVGLEHIFCVEALSDLRAQISSPARHVRSQQPMRCSDTYSPHPDFMIVRGTLRDSLDSLPNGVDLHCAIEVADSSYERDAETKLTAYARAGVPQYIIVNLRNRTAEVYERPDVAAGTYALRTIVAEAETLRLSLGDGVTFDVPLASILA